MEAEAPLLPFSPCGRRWTRFEAARPDEGFSQRRCLLKQPLIRRFSPPSPTRGEEERASAPIIIRRCDGRKLNRNYMARCNQPKRIIGVLRTPGFQRFQLALHGVDRVARKHD